MERKFNKGDKVKLIVNHEGSKADDKHRGYFDAEIVGLSGQKSYHIKLKNKSGINVIKRQVPEHLLLAVS